MKDLKGNRFAAFGILFVSTLLALLLIKPILFGLFWLVGWLLQGFIAIIFACLIALGGYCIYRVEEWAYNTLFTNTAPDFPDMTVDGFDPIEDLSTLEPPDDSDDSAQ